MSFYLWLVELCFCINKNIKSIEEFNNDLATRSASLYFNALEKRFTHKQYLRISYLLGFLIEHKNN
jgi:hypothetical protein